MAKQPDLPGPGESARPDLDGETHVVPIPDGEMPTPGGATRQRQAVTYQNQDCLGEGSEHDHASAIRRTSTDGDAIRAIRLTDAIVEQRVDRSASDLTRETTFDPVQDDSGPQSDRN